MKKSELNSIILDDSTTLEEIADLSYKKKKRKKVKPLAEDFVINPNGLKGHILFFLACFTPACIAIILLLSGINVMSGSKTQFISAGGFDRVSETKSTGSLNIFNNHSFASCTAFVIIFTLLAGILYILANIKKSEIMLYITALLTVLSVFIFIIIVIVNSSYSSDGGSGGGLTYGTDERISITGFGILIAFLLSVTAITLIVLAYKQFKKNN